MDIGEKEEGKASGGSFVRSAGKRPRTKDDDEDDWETPSSRILDVQNK
jgi:hypothetical protein